MIFFNKRIWLISIISLFSTPLMADCGNDSNVAKIAETHIQQRIEGPVLANALLMTDNILVETISSCNDDSYEELNLIATLPNSEAQPLFYRIINGIPTYYLNRDYAYSIKMDDSHAYTSKGMTISAQKRNGIINIPRASISVYSTVNNPKPLNLTSSLIGIVKNNKNETVAQLKLSANIDVVETCYLNTKQMTFNFREIELREFPMDLGKTKISDSQTISIHCDNENRSKNVSIQLTGTTRYADFTKSVIASDNQSIGFVLYHNDAQITQDNKTYLGVMQKQLEPMITAYIYKLREKVEPGVFSGNAEYVIKFD